MKKQVIFTFLSFFVFVAHSAFAEICVGVRCTSAESIGSVSVRVQNGHSTCNGPGCEALGFKRVQRSHFSRSSPITLRPFSSQEITQQHERILQSELKPAAKIQPQTEKSQELLLKSYYDLHNVDGERE